MKKIFIIVVLVLLSISASLYAEDGDGGYAAAFMQIPIGARPTALGGAYISVSNDGAGIFYNPAGMSSISKKIFASSYRVMTLDRKLGYGAFILPTQGQSIIGLSWLYAGSGSVAARNKDGDLLGYDLSQNNHQVSIIFAKRFEKIVSIGFRGSYLHTGLAEMTSFSVSFDLGATFYLSQLIDREKRDLMAIQDIQAGIIIRNLAATYRWNNEQYYKTIEENPFGVEQEDKVPLEIGIGTSARFFNRKLLLAADIVKNSKQGIVMHNGAEYFLTKQFGLRGGYTDRSMTAGFGYMFNLEKFGLAIDYAFSSQKVNEGSEHIFSFDLLF